jgi:hypothetical protein
MIFYNIWLQESNEDIDEDALLGPLDGDVSYYTTKNNLSKVVWLFEAAITSSFCSHNLNLM